MPVTTSGLRNISRLRRGLPPTAKDSFPEDNKTRLVYLPSGDVRRETAADYLAARTHLLIKIKPGVVPANLSASGASSSLTRVHFVPEVKKEKPKSGAASSSSKPEVDLKSDSD